MQRVQVIVVGAGPAGTTAARLLAQAQIDVVLLEREAMPRIKPCGGALTHRALELLPPGHEALLLSHPRHWTFQGPSGSSVTISRDDPYCHVVERQYFDQFLADSARREGALVLEQEPLLSLEQRSDRLRVTTAHRSFETQFVVAADGARGSLARLTAFPRPMLGAAIEADLTLRAKNAHEYQDRVKIQVGQYPWGYAWVIPRGPVLNIGVGSFRPQRFPLKRRFHAFFQQVADQPATSPLAYPLPYRRRFVSLVKGRVLFTGDAAGLLDAFSAEGIYSAMRSGQLAAQSIVRHVRHGEPIEQYSQHVEEEFWPSLKAALKMGLLFYPLANFWSAFFLQNRSLLEDYLDVAMGRVPYSQLEQHTQRALLVSASRFRHQLIP